VGRTGTKIVGAGQPDPVRANPPGTLEEGEGEERGRGRGCPEGQSSPEKKQVDSDLSRVGRTKREWECYAPARISTDVLHHSCSTTVE
jgi:hypothetical protein